MPRAAKTWQNVGVDSVLERGPSVIPAVPHRGGHLELLPLEVLPWPDFESLQWRILRDVEGLRHAQIYGDPGQTQLGLDIVAQAADGSGVALQSKRVRRFGPAKIAGAVELFRTTTRPFDVSRFILGVSREIRSTQAIDRFKELQTQLRREAKPVELELWDQRELSLKLKAAPQIVIEYFGRDIADIFCESFTIGPRVVPKREVVAIREAIARTPEVTTGAGELIAQAKVQSESQPEAALELVEKAQQALTDRGFSAHAAQHEALRTSLLVTVGRGSEATRRRLDELWLALDQGRTTQADIANHDLDGLARQLDTKASRDHRTIAERALYLYNNPLAAVPPLPDLLLGEAEDRARLGALAGETALAAGNHDWLKKSAVRMRNLAAKLAEGPERDTLRVRLRILAAEGSNKWAPVLGDARSLKLGYELGALVQARHARHLALEQKFAEADAAWDEAAGNACLSERWTDAARWIFSRRAFRGRWRPFTSDELLPIQIALSANGPDPTVLPRDAEALEYAAGRLADDKLRLAAIAAQRALRDAVTLSDWEGERRARRLLADVLGASGESGMAARHLVLAGEITALRQLAAQPPAEFLDVTPLLEAKPWWIAGAASQFIAAQADLVPDDKISLISAHGLAVLAAANKGALVDLPTFVGSRYLGAIAALAGVSERLSKEDAEKALSYFEGLPPVGPNQYRHQDEDEAKMVAGILVAHEDLIDRCLEHLVALLGRSDGSRKTKPVEAVVDRLDRARPYLERLSEQGNRWAKDVLHSDHPEQATAAEVRDARSRLEEPLVHTPGVYSVGSASGSVSDSVLVRTLPRRDQQVALEQLVERGSSAYVSAQDRGNYLVAASNLRPPRVTAKRTELLERVLGLVLSPPRSAFDEMDASFQHALGAFRITRRRDTRGEAAHLAATLAKTPAEKQRVRTAALALVGDDSVSELWVTRALQRLGETMAPDVGFLSGQNWALKSLAAILWSKTTEPEPVGYRLATDPDVRVRRALATHLVQHQSTGDVGAVNSQDITATAAKRRVTRGALLEVLRHDPSFSVRAAASGVTTNDV